MKVCKAVIPAAGRGLRMLPLTQMVPKEMFPVGSIPMIQLAIEEAMAAGLSKICVVINQKKTLIREYLERNRFDKAEEVICMEQAAPRGIGDALWQARGFIGREPFLMIIPDQFLIAREPAARQLVFHYDFSVPTVLSSAVKVWQRDAPYFAGARGFQIVKRRRVLKEFEIVALQTETETRRRYRKRPFQLRGFGRTIFPAEILPYLTGKFQNRRTGEVDFWETFRALPRAIHHRGILLKGVPVDLGTPSGFCRFLSRMTNPSDPRIHFGLD